MSEQTNLDHLTRLCGICRGAIPVGHACLNRADGAAVCLGCEPYIGATKPRGLFEVTDGSVRYWVSAHGPNEAMAAVEATDGFESDDTMPLRAKQLHGGDCIDKRFDFQDGESCNLWNAFELARNSTSVFACSEW